MKHFVALSCLCALGCGLPKVALGASVSLGAAREVDAGERRTVRSALWLAMVYAPRASDDARALETRTRAGFESEPQPCAIEVACAWEREAAYEAAWGYGAPPPRDQEGEDQP